jgi:hypothetical protein
VAAGDIFASGGDGGNGGKGFGSLTLAGDGGAGGNAGSVTISAYGGPIDLTSGGTIMTMGGAGGAGGNGDPGNGGAGGAGGTVDIFTTSEVKTFQPLNINGKILDAGLASLSGSVTNGGAGGTGGVLGVTTGIPGVPGAGSIFTFDGTVVIVPTSLGPDGGAVIQGTNQLALTNTAPSTEDTQKKNEDNKKKNQAAACK